jgi:hypothetical protein
MGADIPLFSKRKPFFGTIDDAFLGTQPDKVPERKRIKLFRRGRFGFENAFQALPCKLVRILETLDCAIAKELATKVGFRPREPVGHGNTMIQLGPRQDERKQSRAKCSSDSISDKLDLAMF